jgi:hypothetical protein
MLYGFMTTAVLTAMAVGAGAPAVAPIATAGADSAPAEHVTIVATDYAFQAPDSIPAGVVNIHLVDHGQAPHQAWLIRLADGKTPKDALGALSKGQMPPWMVSLGGPNAAMPGGEADGTLLLAPGSYMIVCLIPNAKGVVHVALGMSRALRVTGPEASASVALPAADDTIGLTNYAFLPSHPLTAGHHHLLIVNRADQLHEAVFVRLAPGKTPADFTAWVDKQAGPPPGALVGGSAGLSPGREAEAEVDLTPGRYGLICFVPDRKDGKPHFMHGMMTELTIH